MIKNKTAVITGAARGIGQAIAKRLAKDGFATAIFDIIPRDDVVENLKVIEDIGNPMLYFQGNLTKADDRYAFVEKIKTEFGRIDILVNNAGVAPRIRADILGMSEESYDFVMGVNLKGTMFLTQIIANEMIDMVGKNMLDNPAIINIASISSYTASIARGEYCISKAGISMLTSLYADRLADEGINVYEVRPGIIKTDMTKTVTDKYDKLIAEGLLPIKRWGYPEDIAKAVSVFASGMLSYSTGDIINVDGGFHIRRL